MGHPDLTVSNFMGNAIGLKSVNYAFSDLSGLITKFTTKNQTNRLKLSTTYSSMIVVKLEELVT